MIRAYRSAVSAMVLAAAITPVSAFAQQALPGPSSPSQGSQSRPGVAFDSTRQKPGVVLYLERNGVDLVHLGSEGGLEGYLATARDGKRQVVYVTPDGLHIVAGSLFDASGVNVTGIQMKNMQDRFRALAPQSQQQSQVPPAAPSTPAPSAETLAIPQPAPSTRAVPEQSQSPVQQQSQAPSSQQSGAGSLVRAGSAERSLAPLSQYRSQRLTAADLGRLKEEAAFFTVGVEGVPDLMMVADPQCPHCHTAWESLRQHVLSGRIRLNIVLIAGLQGSDPIARAILAQERPGMAWLAGQGSVAGVQPPPLDPQSPKWAQTGKYLQANLEFARAVGLTGTPFLAFVGGDGAVYAFNGMPRDPAILIAPFLER
jgi:protein-disulfide isomerase